MTAFERGESHVVPIDGWTGPVFDPDVTTGDSMFWPSMAAWVSHFGSDLFPGDVCMLHPCVVDADDEPTIDVAQTLVDAVSGVLAEYPDVRGWSSLRDAARRFADDLATVSGAYGAADYSRFIRYTHPMD